MSGGDPYRKERKFHKQGSVPGMHHETKGAALDAPAVERQQEFIRMLEEQNRLKKKLKEQNKSDKDTQDKEKEAGFTTHINGEHAHRKNKHARPPAMAKPRAKSAGPTNLHSRSSGGGPRPTAAVAAAPPPGDIKADAKREMQSKSTGALPLHDGSGNNRPKKKWTKPQGILAAERDGRMVFKEPTPTAATDMAEDKDGDCDGDENDDEDGDDGNGESYLDESFEEFDDDVSASPSPAKETAPDSSAPLLPSPALAKAEPLPHPVITPPAAGCVNMPLGNTTEDLNALIQGLSRDKQRDLVGLLQTFTQTNKETSEINALRPSIHDPSTRLTTAQLTNNQREWEADVARQLAREREESQRMIAEAEARRAEMLRKFEAEEKELERLMAMRRQETLNKLREAAAVPMNPSPPIEVVPPPSTTTSIRTIPTDTMTTPSQVASVTPPQAVGATTATASILPTQSTSPEKPGPPPLALPSTIVAPPPITSMSFEMLPPAAPTVTSSVVRSLALSGGLPPESSKAPPTATGPTFDLRLKLLSSWGQTRVIGLTQVRHLQYQPMGYTLDKICVYDMDGNELDVAPESIKLFSGQVDAKPIPKSNSMVRDLARLFNGMAHTTDDKDMWLGRPMDTHPLQIAFAVTVAPSKLCVWNYNGVCILDKLHTAACVRDMEVFLDNHCKWTGSLPETFGSDDENTCTWISVASTMRKKPPVAKDEKTTPPPLPVVDTTAPGSAHAGPIWLTQSTSTKNLRSDGSIKVLDRSVSLNLEATTQAPASDVKMKILDLSATATTDPLEAKPLTSRRGRPLEGSREWLGEAKPIAHHTTSAAPPPLPSLESSWDTLEHFKRTNRSRLDLKPAPAASDVKGIAVTSTPRGGGGGVTLDKSKPPQYPTTAAPSRDKSTCDATRAPTIVEAPKLVIPTLPRGRKLVVECLSTWGDPYYIGLNGIDVFDDCGQRVTFSSPQSQVTAVPASINVLPEYAAEKDPRVATNLVDGINYTCDDLHMWLAPFTPNQVHAVTLMLNATTTLSMVRLWNYNKSRAHSFRGVKTARLLLDNNVIFQGEIRQAPGFLAAVDQCCEVILFTTNEALLSMIEQVDADPTIDHTVQVVHDIQTIPRPTTAEELDHRRPKTTTAPQPPQPQRPLPAAGPPTNEECRAPAPPTNQQADTTLRCDMQGVRARTIKFIFQSTWGDRHYVGLTGLSLWVLRPGQHVVSYPLLLNQLDASPRDLHTLGYAGDPRTLDKLIDGTNNTVDDTHMWLVPFEGAKADLTIHLGPTDEIVYGVDVWNYNKSAEDTFRGVKQVHILVDGAPLVTCVFRKAPGHVLFDFKQTVVFDDIVRFRPPPVVPAVYKTHLLRQDYEPPLQPSGFVLKFVLWSTWGDPYYVGLNGFELYDALGKRLPPPTLVAASPAGLADVNVKHDVRVVDNLFNGQNNTWDASEAWLAPLASSLGNVVYAVYDSLISLSLIKVYNYSKTPDRGAREIEIYVDDLKVYMGSLRQAPSAPGITRTGKTQQSVEFGQPILFTLNPAQVEAEKRKVLFCGSEDQDVLCINEGQVIIESKAMHRAPDPGAEGVIVDLEKRPMTAMRRK
ncbi:Aste57867_13918 [Aphanomyces stellatus]|uniref:Aste57867_13918 protein n=1 Tax=Aphanomyces stellatus TaxID=120398 RepID=A0A485L0A1_9STRA|nr:hypothetical protein As57867_013867 [Aphanomyces stellatus]VFT90748.1 Aste57867_13918 [Aphanomyces stellatus]